MIEDFIVDAYPIQNLKVPLTLLLFASLLVSFYIAWGIGTNDETMANLAGTGFITLGAATALGAVMDFLGAVIYGYKVEETLGRGILIGTLQLGEAFAAILSIAIWLTISSYKRLPVSTTHSAVGSAIGLGIFRKGLEGVNWGSLGNVAAGWLLSPALGFVGVIIINELLYRLVVKRAGGLVGRVKLAGTYSILLLIMASVTSFFRGANDVANATSLVSLIYGEPIVTRLIAGAGMMLGLLVLGRRVIRSVGLTLVELTPLTGLSVGIIVALTMLTGTMLGLPLSGTHILVGAVVGVGYWGRKWINVRELRGMLLAWVVTFPASALLATGLSALFSFFI